MPYKDPKRQLEYQRKWMARRRAEWFEKNCICLGCGSKENLEIDHIDASKKISHKVWSWSENRRNEELAKCQVLCHSCHVLKSKSSGVWQIAEHGGYTMYTKHKCKCTLCRKWKRKVNAQRKERGWI